MKFDDLVLQELSILQQLHNSEINCGVKCFWDSCWTAWIGDDMNGIKTETNAPKTFEDCEIWLRDEAMRLFPDSDFAKSHL